MAFVVLFWILCAVAAYGTLFAYLQGKYVEEAKDQYVLDTCIAVFVAVWGPVGLMLIIAQGWHGYGYKWS